MTGAWESGITKSKASAGIIQLVVAGFHTGDRRRCGNRRPPFVEDYPKKLHPACHCEEFNDEAIQLDRHGALRAPRDDKEW